MFTRFAFILSAFAASSLLAQAPMGILAPKEDLVRVALDTGAGRIVLALDRRRAPVTTANFLSYVDSGKLNGESFYRAMPLTAGGLIQGGITSDARKLRPPIAHEPPSETGLHHVAGAISMALVAPDKRGPIFSF
jgi:peptidyl-prolyl cis-trans isomerase A (cyclophilin A)